MTAYRRSTRDPGRSRPRLYLATPLTDVAALAPRLAAALDAGDVAAVLARTVAADAATLIDHVRTIPPPLQQPGPALLVHGPPASVVSAGADGAHVVGTAALDAAVPVLKPAYIVGCGGLESRHDAMTAGERGADYVMFGEPDTDGRRPAFGAVVARLTWWAELFEVPCVGWAASLSEVAAMVAAGADFIALGDQVWTHPSGPGPAVAAAQIKLSDPAS